jgi:hypothetical protein
MNQLYEKQHFEWMNFHFEGKGLRGKGKEKQMAHEVREHLILQLRN